MKTKVVTRAGAASAIDTQKYLDQLDAIANDLADHVVTLTKAQRRTATKFRKGGDKVIPLIANAATRFGVTSQAADPKEMVSQLAIANALLPVVSRVQALSEMLSDTVLTAHGKSWTIASALHSGLVILAKTNPSVAPELAPISPVFSRKKKAATAPAAASPATTAPTHA
jgi:hypothetical protein